MRSQFNRKLANMRIFLFLLLLASPVLYAQKAAMLTSQPLVADVFVGYDKFNYGYFIENNTLHKSNGFESVQYQNLRLGRISSVDLNNPLKIILLYPDFNSVVLLDNQLNEIATINFSELPQPIVVSAVGNASQNRLWFYDTLTLQIGLFDTNANMYQFITQPMKGTIAYWETDFNYFRWIDEMGRQFSVDVFGKIADLGKVPDFENVRFASDNALVYKSGDQIAILNADGSVDKLIETDPNSYQSFWYKDQILAIFTGHTITNYKITKP